MLSADEREYLVPRIRHALHNLFKDVHYYGVASVPRDFVELPSQIDEHWAFEPEVLNVYANIIRQVKLFLPDWLKKWTRVANTDKASLRSNI